MANGALRVVGAALAASAAALAYASLVETRAYVLRRATIAVLPAGSKPLKVLHLSDLHMAPWQRSKQEWVAALARLEPDFVVDTGDNVGHIDGLDGLERALDPLRGIPGAFVWGSNDYYAPVLKNPARYFAGPSQLQPDPTPLDLDGLRRYLTGLGWTDLDNAAARLSLDGHELELFGVDDPHRGFDDLGKMQRAIDDLGVAAPLPPKRGKSAATDAVLAGEAIGSGGSGVTARAAATAEATTAAGAAAVPPAEPIRFGVAHAPYRRVLDAMVAEGADVIFAGHTHGGQLCIPGYGALVTNCDLPRKQAKGLSTWTSSGRTAHLNVSAGLGTSIYAPVRFACRPEATLLTLTAVAA